MADRLPADRFRADALHPDERMIPRRHALLRIHPGAWAHVLAHRRDLRDEPLLMEWAAKDRPLIARRRCPEDRADHVPSGLPLPPAHGKKRLNLALRPDAIRAVEQPPLLVDIRSSAPRDWLETIDAVLALAASVEIAPRVYGSFAWTALTGLAYTSATSDLDLLWTVAPDARLGALRAGLSRIEDDAPGRLDGEIVRMADDAAVNWREMHGDAGEILVKTIDMVMMRPAAWFARSEAWSR